MPKLEMYQENSAEPPSQATAANRLPGEIHCQRGSVRLGLKTEGDDLALIVCDQPATVAGVFTTNRVQAASVPWSRRRNSVRASVQKRSQR